MKKTAIIYWSGTGNTEAMAQAVQSGAQEAGAVAELFTADSFNAASIPEYDALAFGCPSMGMKSLKKEFEPMFNICLPALKGKSVALFGSYGWGDGEWMRNWKKPASMPVWSWLPTLSFALTSRMRPPCNSAKIWAPHWPVKSKEVSRSIGVRRCAAPGFVFMRYENHLTEVSKAVSYKIHPADNPCKAVSFAVFLAVLHNQGVKMTVDLLVRGSVASQNSSLPCTSLRPPTATA